MSGTDPTIEVICPKAAVAGQPLDVQVILTCSRKRTIQDLEVILTGRVRYLHKLGQLVPRSLAFRPLPTKLFHAPREFEAGRHVFVARLVLPAQSLPTYRGDRFWVDWYVEARAGVPWAWDPRARVPVFVTRPQVPFQDPGPILYSTDARGPVGRAAYAEISLPTVMVRPGQPLQGEVALSNTHCREYRGVSVRLVAKECVPTLGGYAVTELCTTSTWIPVSAPTEGEALAFSLPIPAGITPSFYSRAFTLHWVLEVRLLIEGTVDSVAPIPLHVVTDGHVMGNAPAALLPAGARRLSLVWAGAAQASGLRLVDDELRTTVGRFSVSIGQHHCGRTGVLLVGRVTCVDLDVGLHIDHDGKLATRDPDQTKLLGSATQAAAAAAGLTRAFDTYLVCVSHDPGIYSEPIAEFAARVVAFVRVLGDVLQQLPAPADMAHMVPAFQDAAGRLHATFDAGSMDIVGFRGDIGFAVLCEWDGEQVLYRTSVCVWPPVAIDARWHQRWSGDAEPGPMPEGLEDLLSAATGLLIDDHVIGLTYPPCTDGLEPFINRTEMLLRVAKRLTGARGVYR